MLKNIRLIIITLITLISFSKASASQSLDSTVVFRFMSKSDIFWASYKDNKKEFDRLASFIQYNRQAIMRGTYPVKVNGYCNSFDSQLQNLKASKVRSNRVKSYMITLHGLREENFITKNYALTYDGDKDVVLVIFKLSKKDIKKETKIVGETVVKPMVTIDKPTPTPIQPVNDTIIVCSMCVATTDLTTGGIVIFDENHAKHTTKPVVKTLPEPTTDKKDIADNTAIFVLETPKGFKTNAKTDTQNAKRLEKERAKNDKLTAQKNKKEQQVAAKQLKANKKESQKALKLMEKQKKSKVKAVKVKTLKVPKVKATKAPKVNAAKAPKMKATKTSSSIVKPASYQLKTNILYLLATAYNLEFETLFADDRFSVNLEGQYAHTNWDNNTQRFRLGSVSPELRYYPIKNKLFVGAYYNYTDFNIKFGSTGQQGYSNGAGITVGTKIPIGRQFGFEFALSAGFNSNIFDKYTLENGTANYSGSYNVKYFGPTKAKVSFFWKIGANKKQVN